MEHLVDDSAAGDTVKLMEGNQSIIADTKSWSLMEGLNICPRTPSVKVKFVDFVFWNLGEFVDVFWNLGEFVDLYGVGSC